MPACSASHPACPPENLDNGDFPGRLGRLTSLVEHLDGEAERAVEAEGHRGRGYVVLDRPRHAHCLEPLAMELVENAEPATTNRGDHSVDLLRFEPVQQLIGQINFLHEVVLIHPPDVKWVYPGGLTQDSPASRIQVLDQLGTEGDQATLRVTIRMKKSFEPILDADQLPSQIARGESRPP